MKLRKTKLDKRSAILYKAYTDYVNSIENKQNYRGMVKGADLNRRMTDLFVQMNDLSLTGYATSKQILSDIDDKIVCTSYRESLKRDYIDRILSRQLVGWHQLGKNHAEELFDVFRARILGWNPHSDKQEIAPQVNALPSFNSEERVRGIIYSGRLASMYKEALQLNANGLEDGSVWATTTCVPELIRDELIARGIDERKIHIHTSESLVNKKIYFPQGIHQELQLEVVASALSGLKDINADRVTVIFNTLLRGLAKMGRDSKNYILSPEDITLENLVNISKNCEGADERYAAAEALNSIAKTIGVTKVDAECPRTLQIWEDLFSEVKVVMRVMKNMFTNDICSHCVDYGDGVVKYGEHHIFHGEEVAHIGAILLRNYELSPRLGELMKHEYPDVFTDTPMPSCFIEMGKYEVEGFCVMPAASRGLRLAKNVFFEGEPRTDENFASVYCNSMLKVVRANPLQEKDSSRRMIELLMPSLDAYCPNFFATHGRDDYTYPFVVC